MLEDLADGDVYDSIDIDIGDRKYTCTGIIVLSIPHPVHIKENVEIGDTMLTVNRMECGYSFNKTVEAWCQDIAYEKFIAILYEKKDELLEEIREDKHDAEVIRTDIDYVEPEN